MAKPEKHLFICTQARPEGHPRGSCSQRGCNEVAEALWNEMMGRDLLGRFALTSSGCMGPCNLGPNILVYPEGVMYTGVQRDDIKEIIESHLLADTPVERLLAPEDVWG